MDDLLERSTRCPHCRATIRPGAPWCTLCHADLRPQPEPEPEPEPVVASVPVAPATAPVVDPLTAPATALGLAAPGPSRAAEPTWPCTTCGASNPLSADACGGCGAGFLAGLRESEPPLLDLPGVGDLTKMSRGQRLGLAFGAVAAFIAVLSGLVLLFG